MSINNKKSKNIPAFLQKITDILNEPKNDIALEWAPNGVGFIILNEEILIKHVLPKYFKHSNYSSFIRQLNMYDFHKIRKGNIQNYFHHDKFVRGDSYSISQIRRKPEKKKCANAKISKNNQNGLSFDRYYSSQSEILAGSINRKTLQQQQPTNKKSQITLNSIHTIKPKSEESIILMRENNHLITSRPQPIFYSQCEQSHNQNYSHIDLNRGDSYQNEQQQLNNHNHYNEDSNHSSKMSINNEIQHSKYLIEHQKQILIPSHNHIYHFINSYQLANFGLFM